MREIKFRAWNLVTREMCSVTSLNFWYGNELNSVSIDTSDGEIPEVDVINLNIMQYTGLKDKNGKEIYEGDIISNGLDYAVVKYGVVNCGCCHVVYGFSTNTILIDLSSSAEVIGNIHENHELLEG